MIETQNTLTNVETDADTDPGPWCLTLKPTQNLNCYVRYVEISHHSRETILTLILCRPTYKYNLIYTLCGIYNAQF